MMSAAPVQQMLDNSGVSKAWDSSVGWAGNKIGSLFKVPDAPTLESPTSKSSTPTQAEASTTALQNQLAKEHTQFMTSTYLTGASGSGGLFDEPTTTSRTLLGS